MSRAVPTGQPESSAATALHAWFESMAIEASRSRKRGTGIRRHLFVFSGRAKTVLRLFRELGVRTTVELLVHEVAVKLGR